MDNEAENQDNLKQDEEEKEEQQQQQQMEPQSEQQQQQQMEPQSEQPEQQQDENKTSVVKKIRIMEDLDDDDDYYEYPGYEDVSESERDLKKTASTETVDWEKEAKKTVRLSTVPSKEKRKTIYELDAYASSGPSKNDLLRLSTANIEEVRKQPIRYSASMGVPGIARLNLSPLTQKVVGCVIGENVSTEYPWVYVRKEIIEDNIYLHEESSDFLPVKDEVQNFPDKKVLIGYVPSLTEEGQFYICLTEAAKDAVVNLIQKQRMEHENRVRTAVYKPVGIWEDLGSAEEIDSTSIQNTRPLLEYEVVCPGDKLNTQLSLVDRKVDDQRDGYIELLPYRQIFENVACKLQYTMTQVTPAVQNAEIQTLLSVPKNFWVQYKYEYTPLNVSKFNEETLDSFKQFLYRVTDKMCDQLMLNATWDIYRNDYGDLVRHERDTQYPIPAGYTEHLSFHDEIHVVEKVINDLCWHPLWTGIAFAAYTRYGRSQHIIGPKSDKEVIKAYENNYVLVWSFNDTLAPKLLLECPREVSVVAVSPLDGNQIVGGCSNGQVVFWHIPGKIEQVEAVVVTTTAQVKYKAVIKSLTTWMQEAIGISTIRPSAMSPLKDSQRGPITNIVWISPYNKVEKNGTIASLPEDVNVEDLSSQFITSSQDGTIAFWELNLDALEQKTRPSRKKYGKDLEGLTKSTTRFTTLHFILKPYYILIVPHPVESRRAVITTISIHVPKFDKERVDVSLPTSDLTIRRFFKNVIKKPDFVMKPEIHIGTVEGGFGCITWEGYEFTTDLPVNSETCTWSWYQKIHDGPVTHSVRSRYDSGLIVTIGGKVFAVWKEGTDEPLMWKKADVRLTACVWGKLRPTILILGRMDGSMEIWDLMIKTNEPCVRQSLSGKIITGIFPHELHLDPYVIGFCDFNGILRTFLPPLIFVKADSANLKWMDNFIQRQITRVEKCKLWKTEWKQKKFEDFKEKQKQAEELAKKKKLEEEEALQKTKKMESALAGTRITTKRYEMIEEARERWKARELRHMQQVLLEKKGLRKEELEKQREPILKMRQDAKRKKEKLQQTLNMQEEIFEHSKNIFLHRRKKEDKKKRISDVPEKVETSMEEDLLQQEVQMEKLDPNEEILLNFMQTQTTVLAELEKSPFQHSFNWRKILKECKTRQGVMDSELRKLIVLSQKFKKPKLAMSGI